jgi:phosphoglycerate transport regulatory protein PgtC
LTSSALAGKYSGFPVEFVYPDVTAVVPANIALVAGGKNADEARKFISYTLSPKASSCCSTPRSAACPSCPTTSWRQGAGRLPRRRTRSPSAPRCSSTRTCPARYHVVVGLFDQMVTFRLKDLQAATKAIHDAERQAESQAQCAGRRPAQAGAQLWPTRPWWADRNKDAAFLELFRKNKKDVACPSSSPAWKTVEQSKARVQLRQARELAEPGLALIK